MGHQHTFKKQQSTKAISISEDSIFNLRDCWLCAVLLFAYSQNEYVLLCQGSQRLTAQT